MIEELYGCPLQEIVDRRGQAAFLEIEEKALLSLKGLDRHVVSTGGSAVYSDHAMHHLKEMGYVVFLDVPLDKLEDRIKNFGERGIARQPGQGLGDLYVERYPLYKKYADLTVGCSHITVGEVCRKVSRLLVEGKHRAVLSSSK